MTHAYTTHSYVDNGGSYQLLRYLFISHVTMLDLIIHSFFLKLLHYGKINRFYFLMFWQLRQSR